MKTKMTKLLLMVIVMMMPLGLQAQRMTQKLAKKAGVVVLIDKYWDGTNNRGNIITLLLKDKSRADDWKKGVIETETCLETKVHTSTFLPVTNEGGYSFNILNSQFSLFTLSPSYASRVEYPEFSIEKAEDDSFLIFEISDKYGSRKYAITKVLFYKTFIDVELRDVLGEENDPTLAWSYIAQMFKVYEK